MTRSRSSKSTLAALLGMGLGGVVFSSCAPADFPSQAIVQTVRILASRADKPYAKPGDSVTVDLLAYDGRVVQPEPMQVSWLPFLCENPANDAYYACFAKFGAGVDGGAPGAGGAGGATAGLPAGTDLTPYLHLGASFDFTMPADAVSSHPVQAGITTPYGLVILFNFACAGHLEYVPLAAGDMNPQAVPIGCFDKAHHQLSADDFVIGFTRVYAYDTLTNTNPVITQVSLPSGLVAPEFGVTSVFEPTRCDKDNIDLCPENKIGPVIAPPDPNESVNVSFYTTVGQFKYDVRLLWDVSTGSVGGPSDTDTSYFAPINLGSAPGPSGLIWMIVRDNRGGANWVTVPVHIL